MRRKVKCQITKETGDSSEFFKAPNGKYYKTEEIYLQWKRKTENRAACVDIICECGGYKDGNYAPTLMNKIIADFGNRFGYDVLRETLEGCQNDFEWANDNKQFDSEVQRLFYYKAIIGNKIADVYKRHQFVQRQVQSIPMEDMGDISKVGCATGGGKDLSNLLGEI